MRSVNSTSACKPSFSAFSRNVKLLRIGGNETIKLNVRIIVATHKNLQEETKSGRFREDLYYRLLGLPIHLPPLRERGQDAIMIAKHFLGFIQPRQPDARLWISAEAQERLLQHPWPGNVRELKSVVELAAVMCSDGEIQGKDLTFANVSTEQSFLLREMSLQ